MSRNFRQLIEQQIRAAEAKGELSGLSGEGKPLPKRPEEAMVDTATLVGHRIMAEAGALPEEIKLKEALRLARVAYQGLTDPEEKHAAMQAIADLEMRYNIAADARKKFLS
jgi:hypothetical protein